MTNVGNLVIEVIGECGDLGIEIHNKNPELDVIITSLDEIEQLEQIIKDFKDKL